LENLQPYRRLVSREGNIVSHFYLKDSYRVLKFSIGEDIYESKILMDALTGGSEAYLFKNNIPLNDGKLTTYDKEIEELLGSEDLFFNSIFSGQKSKGIAQLKTSERRELFYELLNLNEYEAYCEKAKEKAKDFEKKISAIEGEKKVYENKAQESAGIEEEIEKINGVIESNRMQIEQMEVQEKDLLQQKENKAIEKATIEADSSRNKEIIEEVNKLEEEQRVVTIAFNSKMFEIEKEKSLGVNTEEEEKKLAELNREKEALPTANNEIKNQIKALEQEIDSANQSQATGSTTIARLEKILANKTTIDNKISKKTEIEIKLSEISSQIEEAQKELLEAKEHQFKVDTLTKEIESHSKATALISTVPCNASIGLKCVFLKNAYESKNKIDELTANLKELTKEGFKDSEIKAKILSLGDVKTELNAELSEIAKFDWSFLKQQANEAETQIAVLKSKDYKKILEGLNNQIVSLKAQAIAIENARDEKIKSIEKEIISINHTLSGKIAQHLENLALRENNVKDNFNNQVSKIKKEIDKFKSQFKHINTKEIDEEILRVQGALNLLNSSMSFTNGILSNANSKLVELQTRLAETTLAYDKAKTLESQMQFQGKELSEWNFLVKAFDKTGIPVLKLENSGYEITSIANELLELFDNKFRVVFETTEPIKNGKGKTKETFSIKVIDEDGICELSNKSGGQQVWIETALQLAISLVVREQGKRIETSFLDEKDGALDVDSANNYLTMIREAHKKAGVYNTFVITHRKELINLISQKVILKDGVIVEN